MMENQSRSRNHVDDRQVRQVIPTVGYCTAYDARMSRSTLHAVSFHDVPAVHIIAQCERKVITPLSSSGAFIRIMPC